ncbi:MAG: 2Fe-2S iron-sulfur cluster-binding protein [Desulfobacterales bacterium]|jgi:NADH dehydrogenase/NADH:ubiquinone oxidoreductase subunit G
MIALQIDDKKIEVAEGSNLLEACLDNGIYIPNLCHLKGMQHPPASCRLCFVEIEGSDHPVCACSTRVVREMSVHTNTPGVRQLQKTALQLLLSAHDVDCKNCPANRQCPLQDMAKFLKVALKTKGLDRLLKETRIDAHHPFLDHYPNRCVLCGRCVYVCSRQRNRAGLTFARRGIDTVIAFYGHPQTVHIPCDTCQACVEVCPVAALLPKA